MDCWQGRLNSVNKRPRDSKIDLLRRGEREFGGGRSWRGAAVGEDTSLKEMESSWRWTAQELFWLIELQGNVGLRSYRWTGLRTKRREEHGAALVNDGEARWFC